MHNSFLIFDFGSDEKAVQQARHKLESWKQAFRLDKKLLYKFEREEPPAGAAPADAAEEKAAPKSANRFSPIAENNLIVRHGRACPGHPRFSASF